MTLFSKKKKTETESGKKRMLLDPDAPRENVTDTGGEYAGRHPEPREEGPDIVHPGPGGLAPGQTSHE
jgi:hypothetical protein